MTNVLQNWPIVDDKKMARKTRPYAADVSDATKRLESAIDNALDATGGDVLHASVGGVDYLIAPAPLVEPA